VALECFNFVSHVLKSSTRDISILAVWGKWQREAICLHMFGVSSKVSFTVRGQPAMH
jgi:hypothetical protein